MRWLSVIVLFLVGCGEVKAKQPDGGGGGGDGGGGDGAMPDGPPVGEATIEVQLSGAPTGGLKVNFQEADGSVVGDVMTDTTGKAKATVHIGAMVTVAVAPRQLVTITGVNPGETVVLKTPKPYDGSTAGDVTFAATVEAPNKSFYRVDVGDYQYVTAVAMTSGTRTLNLLRGNLDGTGKFNLFAGTYDVNNKLISYNFVNGITPSSTGITNVNLGSNWRTDLNDYLTMLSGAPSGATQLTVTTFNEQATFQFSPGEFGATNTRSATITGGNASLYNRYPGGFGDFIQTQVSIRFGTTRESVEFWRRMVRPAGALTITANDFPVQIGVPTLDKTNATRPVANWTLTGSTVNGDGTIVEISWKDPSNVGYSWIAYVKPDATSLTFPSVSSSLAGQAPAQSTFTGLAVSQANLEPMAGYSAFHLAPIPANGGTYPIPPGFSTWSYSSNSTTTP
jgi:hypothetical protein